MFIKPMSCKCSELNEFYEPHPDEEFHEISKSFEEIESFGLYWLAKCEVCDQKWIIESMSRQPLLVKENKVFDIRSFDEMRYRKLSFLKMKGGNSKINCAWANCTNKAVKNMAVCVDHVFQ